MRKILLYLVALAGLSLPLAAQETYSLPANAGQTAIIRQYVLGVNRATCSRLQLAVSCTQAEACTASGFPAVPGGASCTAGNATVAGRRIYPDTLAGREEFIQIVWVLPRFTEAGTSIPQQGYNGYCIWWATQNQTTRNAECAKASMPNECSICP